MEFPYYFYLEIKQGKIESKLGKIKLELNLAQFGANLAQVDFWVVVGNSIYFG